MKVAPTDPAGGYFVSVEAAGKGCPADSWTTNVSSDGRAFNTTFSAYEVTLDTSDGTVSNGCDVTIKLHSPQGLSFSVTSLAYSGYGYLETAGMRGSFVARYAFGRLDAGSTRRDESGPYDGAFAFEDKLTDQRVVWSPCGVDHALTVRTELSLSNSQPAGAGYANLLSLDGQTNLVLGVNWKTCRPRR